MKKYILLLALCSASFGCKKAAESEVTTIETQAAAENTEGAPTEGTAPEEAAAEAPGEPADGEKAPEAGDTVIAFDADSFRAESKITVVSQGSEPRQTLRLDLAKIRTGSATMRTEIRTTAMGQAMVLPRVLNTIRITDVKHVGDKVVSTMEISPQRFEKLSDDPMHLQMLEAMKEQPGNVEMRFSYAVDAQGGASDMKLLSASEEATEALSMMMNNLQSMTGNFPAEAMGVGGSWTITTTMTLGANMSIEVRANNTITAINKDSVAITTKIDAPDLMKLIQDGVLGDTGGMTPSEANLTGNGQATFRFDSLLPEMEQRIHLTMKMTVEGQDVGMVMDAKLSLSKD